MKSVFICTLGVKAKLPLSWCSESLTHNTTSHSGQCVTGVMGVGAFHNCVYLRKTSLFLFSNFNILLQQTEAKKKKRSSEEQEKITVRHLPSSSF